MESYIYSCFLKSNFHFCNIIFTPYMFWEKWKKKLSFFHWKTFKSTFYQVLLYFSKCTFSGSKNVIMLKAKCPSITWSSISLFDGMALIEFFAENWCYIPLINWSLLEKNAPLQKHFGHMPINLYFLENSWINCRTVFSDCKLQFSWDLYFFLKYFELYLD